MVLFVKAVVEERVVQGAMSIIEKNLTNQGAKEEIA
jgi:hypothetical protein